MTGARVPCIVPFCRRTRRRCRDEDDQARWICGKHWRHVSRTKKLLMRRCARRWRAIPDKRTWRAYHWNRLFWHTFDAAAREAIEAAGGIG